MRWFTSPRFPAPGRKPNAVIFKVNTLSTYNIFEAARRLKIRNVVWASSETVLGLPFNTPPPYAPVDEEYAAPAGDRLLAVKIPRRGDGEAILPAGTRS